MDFQKAIRNIGNRLGNVAKKFGEEPPKVPHPDENRIKREVEYMKRIRTVNPKFKVMQERRAKLHQRRHRGTT